MPQTPVGPSTLALAPGDRRVFVLAVSSSDADLGHQTHLSMLKDGKLDAGALPQLLDSPDLQVSAVEIFAIKDIEAMGLLPYLRDAYDIPEESLRDDAQKLSAIEGDVVVLGAGALGRVPRQISLPPELSLIGAYAPLEADNSTRDLPAAQDAGPIQQSPASSPGTEIPRWLVWGLALKILLVVIITLVVIRL